MPAEREEKTTLILIESSAKVHMHLTSEHARGGQKSQKKQDLFPHRGYLIAVQLLLELAGGPSRVSVHESHVILRHPSLETTVFIYHVAFLVQLLNCFVFLYHSCRSG